MDAETAAKTITTVITWGELRGLRKLAAVGRLAQAHALDPFVLSALEWIDEHVLVAVERPIEAEPKRIDFDEPPRFVCRIEDPMGGAVAVGETRDQARERALHRFREDMGRDPAAESGITINAV